ncbi:MAG: cysteine--tRNA ligase [Candidatus Omnitrophota bacterium]|nr:cysteine--tRNA ligase [Candidatus Omnitrophota bacterium]
MPIRFTNTLTGRKEDFLPLKPPQVTMYVCGVTVYDDCHIGHARGAVVFDTLRRFLEASGLKVRHIRNVTDVDDKIIDRARKEGGDDLKAGARAVAERYTGRFQADFARLGLLPPSAEPKATEFIPKMIRFIEGLIREGVAYPGSDGVYFAVRELARRRGKYGDLSRQKLDQMMENAHVDAGAGKKDPLDFALWKKAKPEEPSWPSPWGEGRPGWHIECTTMSTDLLGDEFDIHGGGQDLVFPHHENELAQALGAGKPFAKIWLHNGLLTVNGQKMSKSLGNFVTIEEALKKHPADVLRMFFLSAHYRSPMDFTWERLDEAARAYERWTGFIAHEKAKGSGAPAADSYIGETGKNFFDAMEDDLNTPEALACLHGLAGHPGGSGKLLELGRLLGFFQSAEKTDPAVEKLITERDEARRKKDFTTSDRIRKQLAEMGYVVEDTTGKTVVRERV